MPTIQQTIFQTGWSHTPPTLPGTHIGIYDIAHMGTAAAGGGGRQLKIIFHDLEFRISNSEQGNPL